MYISEFTKNESVVDNIFVGNAQGKSYQYLKQINILKHEKHQSVYSTCICFVFRIGYEDV
jgi:hypothetical protein